MFTPCGESGDGWPAEFRRRFDMLTLTSWYFSLETSLMATRLPVALCSCG